MDSDNFTDPNAWVEHAHSSLLDSVHQVEVWLNDLLENTIEVHENMYRAETINKLSVTPLDLSHVIVVAVVGYYLVEDDKEMTHAGAIAVQLGTPVSASR